jgi:lysine-specific histone demethylase 1
MVDQLADVSKLTPQDVRMLNWHIANLEHSHGCNLDELSLGSWNQAEGYEFSGRHCMVRDGYSSLCRGLYIYPDKLDVRFKTTVKVIEYDEESAAVFLENGERIDAARVVVTVPLGVLKDRTIQFIPDLPQWKTDSIERLGFGVVNKVCLVFEDVFWDESQDVICISQDGDGNDEMHMSSYQNTRGRFFMFLNCTKSTRKPCLVGMVAGNAAIHLVNESDDELVEQARCVLEKVYPKCRSVELTESIVTRWQIDPFSRGSFSYVGLEASGADFDLVGRQIGNSLHFAGEATNRMYPGTVHGAYISGLRAAKDVLTSFVGEIEVPSPLIPFRDHHALRNPYPTYPSSQVSSARPTPKLPGSHYPMDTAQIRASLLSEPSLRRSTDAAIYSDSDRPGVSQTKRKALLVDSEVTQDVNMQDLRDVEARYRELRDAREALDNERLRHDLLRELGPRPVKPERSGANPFLIYQKDFWDICKRETDLAKQKETGDPNVKASRNEVRAALGKRWRELPDNEKQPYIEETDNIKRTNNKKSEEFRRQIKQYDSEAEMFRRRWKEEHSTPPSEEEQRLAQIVAEGHEHDRRMFAKRNRMR